MTKEYTPPTPSFCFKIWGYTTSGTINTRTRHFTHHVRFFKLQVVVSQVVSFYVCGYILTNLIFNSIQSLRLVQLSDSVMEHHMICDTLFHWVAEYSSINILTSYNSLRHLWCKDFVWPVLVGSTIIAFFLLVQLCSWPLWRLVLDKCIVPDRWPLPMLRDHVTQLLWKGPVLTDNGLMFL